MGDFFEGPLLSLQAGMGIVCTNAISMEMKLTVEEEKNCPWGKEIMYGAHSHTAITRLGCLIVNIATGCHSHGQALSLNTVIPARFCAMFWLRKSKCYESFKSELLFKILFFVGGTRFQSFCFESVPMHDRVHGISSTFAWDKDQISAVIEKLVSNNKVGGIS